MTSAKTFYEHFVTRVNFLFFYMRKIAIFFIKYVRSFGENIFKNAI
jgi:hypothetical protein